MDQLYYKTSLLGAGFLLYALYSSIIFNGHKYDLQLGLLLALLANALWIILARSTKSKDDLLFWAIAWDSAVVIASVIIPIIFFGVKTNVQILLGISCVIFGLFLMKFS